MAEDPYELVVKDKMKMKGDSSIKKKKKKDKNLLDQVSMVAESVPQKPEESSDSKRTKAELAFKKMQEKNQTKRILEKACMTHKERVEKFNQHLDSLTEHFDIPKVSWTK
ncbi:PREDICTED: protein FAM32A [Nicrophorus vespilloides]|uniref:Protein FAM32A n=1 Tax=Nicrophorus vespilloides TaxID=110193 RepID=A0ABM1MXT0_NICVS|nr:PREDICTED: protein FAM32A [Nicrophorus vespilloides]